MVEYEVGERRDEIEFKRPMQSDPCFSSMCVSVLSSRCKALDVNRCSDDCMTAVQRWYDI